MPPASAVSCQDCFTHALVSIGRFFGFAYDVRLSSRLRNKPTGASRLIIQR
jgi:hypothetical protein